jgi:hypothetical protein
MSERRRGILVYRGVRQTVKGGKTVRGKKSYSWQEISSIEDNDGRSILDQEELPGTGNYPGPKNIIVGPSIGAIISVEMVEDGTSCFPSTSRLVGFWKNEDDVVRWRGESRAIEGEIEFEQKAAREARRDVPKEQLEPFREAYWLCRNARQRSQFLGWVIEQITSPDPLRK